MSPTWPAVFHEHHRFVRSVVRRLAGPELDVDDLVQDVFVVVHRKLHTVAQQDRVRSWIYGISRRVVAYERRKQRLRAALRGLWLSPASTAPGRTPEQETHGMQLERRVYAALDKLTEKRREALVLFALEEMSGEEIARLLGIPEATVWTRLHAARRQLLTLLESDRGDDLPLRELLEGTHER